MAVGYGGVPMLAVEARIRGPTRSHVRYVLFSGPRTGPLADRGPVAPFRFRRKTDAARWLARHGIDETTPQTWQGWLPDELTPAVALAFALDLQRAAQASGNWRVSWCPGRCAAAQIRRASARPRSKARRRSALGGCVRLCQSAQLSGSAAPDPLQH